MPDKEMTPSKAIIILERLNTDGRISVDREELRAAIRVGKEALKKQIPRKAIKTSRFGNFDELYSVPLYLCPDCRNELSRYELNLDRCRCGQVLDWGE